MTQRNPAKPLRLYLIRHGAVEGVATGTLLGRTDTPLSPQGLEKSRQVAERLSSPRLSAIYSSDLQRAKAFAEVIANRHGLQVQARPAWREIDMGEWEGRTFAALHEETPKLVSQVFNDPASFQYPGGESFVGFTARVQAALDQLLTIHTSGNVALVVHGGVCRAIIGTVLEVPMRNWLRLAQDYGCLNVIEWHDGSPAVVLLNSLTSGQNCD